MMDREDISQTFIISFIVAFVIEAVSFAKEIFYSSFEIYFGPKIAIVSVGFLFLLLLAGILMCFLAKHEELIYFLDKDTIEILKRYGIWTLLVSMSLLAIIIITIFLTYKF
jgi:hypothetical protein